jgi:hypothetical protein
MKKIFYFLFIIGITSNAILAQEKEEFKPSGSPQAKIFFNFHHDLDETSAFEIQRAYLGYKYNMSENFSGSILLDVGTSDVNIGDSLKGKTTNSDYNAFLKNAFILYKKGKISIDAGLIGLKQLSLQESYWGHRYVYKSFLDYSKMGTTADLGASVEYKIVDMLSIDYTIRNGEGFKLIQSDNAYRNSLGWTLSPVKGLSIRGVYDYIEKSEAQITIAHFVGYKNDKISLGGEYNYQINSDYKKDQTLTGISVYGSYNINTLFQVFGRFDNMKSVKVNNAADNWNIKNDGSLIIAGLQYKPVKNLDIAINYQGWLADKSGGDKNFVYVNLQISF